MKSFLIGLGILLTSITANAQTKNVRLEMSQVPTSPATPEISVLVLADGTIEQISFIQASMMLPRVSIVGHLTVEKMDEINNLIEDARNGEIVTLPNVAECFVAPFTIPMLTADNGNVFLQSGGLCSQEKVNTSADAKELVSIITKLYNEFSNVITK